MTVRAKTGTAAVVHQPGKPKRTRQGRSLHTKLAATIRNGRRKRYLWQGS